MRSRLMHDVGREAARQLHEQLSHLVYDQEQQALFDILLEHFTVCLEVYVIKQAREAQRLSRN